MSRPAFESVKSPLDSQARDTKVMAAVSGNASQDTFKMKVKSHKKNLSEILAQSRV